VLQEHGQTRVDQALLGWMGHRIGDCRNS
jgi:hypothetical protein